MQDPLITIVVLTYKKFNYFIEAIDSVLNQKYSNIELIISDDGSDNFDLAFISSYINAHKQDNIRNLNIIHHAKNIGTVKNYNNAIRESNGNYIIGLAIDDCFTNGDVVDAIVNCFLETQALIITSYRDVYDENLIIKKEILPNKKQVQIIKNNKNVYKKLCKGNFISGACTYYSKTFFEMYGLFSEKYRLLEDYPKYLQCTRNECNIEFLSISAIKYREGGVSTIGGVISSVLKNDFEKTWLYEIIPFKENTGIALNRLNRFNYYRMINCKQFYKLIILFPDIIVYKSLCKLKHVLLKNETRRKST